MAWAASAGSRSGGAAASRVVAPVRSRHARAHEGRRRPAQRLGGHLVGLAHAQGDPRAPSGRDGQRLARPALEAPLGEEADRSRSAAEPRRDDPAGKTGVPTAPASAGTSSARVKVIGMRLLLGLGGRAGRDCPSCQRAMVHSRSERRLRYGTTDEPGAATARALRSARRTTVRATSRAAAVGLWPGRTNSVGGSNRAGEVVDQRLEGGDHVGRDQGLSRRRAGRGARARWPPRP